MPVNIQLSKIDFLRIQESEVRKLLSPDYWLLTSLVSWWAWVESNYRPHPYQGCALPAELQAQGIERRSSGEYPPIRLHNAGGAGRDRTGDLLNANQALSQLSYSPISAAQAPPEI
jgi:hypothetical protein